ncbi:MAG: gliding motility protein GldC [Parafilimonas sp.]
MENSTITIQVKLGEDKVPQQIEWNATGTTTEHTQQAKGLMLAFWDGEEKTAMRIDLWTKDMLVDEMADFFYQTLSTMADTYNRATHHQELTDEMKEFAKTFYQKFREKQLKEGK